jgi:2-methylcitrate dehydratase PrpD
MGALSYQHKDLPEDVERLARLAILDNFGCAIRGMKEPLSQFIGEELYGRKVDVHDLMPNQQPSPLHNRAMLYAGAAHAIDFDDTLIPAQSAHAGSTIVGAALQVGCAQGASGRELIAAVLTGYETAARVGALLHPDHYLLGYHPTATVGVFGAAAAVGRLMSFDADQMCAALGLAATQACGLKCTFGTMAKPYNAAHAASAGLLSARLVARGFTAPPDALEADKGYLSMFLGLPDAERKVEGPEIFRIRGNAFKFHAACHATHPMIEALCALSAEHEIVAGRIDCVDVSTSPLCLKTASIGEPRTGLEGKFSFSHVAAIALAGCDTASDDAYSDAALRDRDLAKLRTTVRTIDSELDPFSTTVTVSTRDGSRHEKSFDFRNLMKDQDAVSKRLEAKFITNTAATIGEARAHRLRADLLALAVAPDIAEVFRISGQAS